jgi:hypothetical protein
MDTNSVMVDDHNGDNMDDDFDDDDDDEDDRFEDSNDQRRCVSPDSCDDSGSDSTPIQAPEVNDNLDGYLDLLRNMDEQQRQNDVAILSITRESSIIDPSMSNSQSMPSAGVATNVRRCCGGYEPYLYSIPFVVPGSDATSVSVSQSSMRKSQSISCRIVFNLALIHQMVSRTSCKVASFYEIAATLLSNLPSAVEDSEETAAMVLLRVVILNNFGVWCYENGEGETMMNSFEQLMDTIQDDHDVIDPTILQGVRANVQAFLTPQNGASLAA